MAESSERSSNPKRSSDSSVRHKGTSKRSATKRRKVVAQRHFSADSEDERLKERLNAKFNVKQRKTVDDSAQGCCLRRSDGGSLGVCNSERHDAIIRRAECARINRLHKGAENNDAVPTRWKCALCQQRSSRSFLGDLYGPYFVRVQGNHWPSFLAKKTAHLNPESEYIFDLWLHGMCAVTAPDIQMCANQLPALETKIITFWKQHCAVCSKEGATIDVKGKLMHFPCAIMKGYKMDIPIEQITPDAEDN